MFVDHHDDLDLDHDDADDDDDEHHGDADDADDDDLTSRDLTSLDLSFESSLSTSCSGRPVGILASTWWPTWGFDHGKNNDNVIKKKIYIMMMVLSLM